VCEIGHFFERPNVDGPQEKVKQHLTPCRGLGNSRFHAVWTGAFRPSILGFTTLREPGCASAPETFLPILKPLDS